MARVVSTRFISSAILKEMNAYSWIPLDWSEPSDTEMAQQPVRKSRERNTRTNSIQEHLRQLNRERVRKHRERKRAERLASH